MWPCGFYYEAFSCLVLLSTVITTLVEIRADKHASRACFCLYCMRYFLYCIVITWNAALTPVVFVTDAVWNTEENRQFRENREHILALMEHLNIIARPVLHAEDGENRRDV